MPLVLGASSMTSLLFDFYGRMERGHSERSIVLPAVAVLVLFSIWAKRTQRLERYNRILAGLWAGGTSFS